MKRLVTLAVGLALAVPAVHFETSVFDRINAALGTTAGATAAPAPDLHVDIPKALQPLIDALHR
ncbi:MAG TPA: hypothetical protein VFA83_07570 [Acidimicrobiales bacterium]|nr:hypothetical protein [Acidimicrobiales bacterium]